jgi:hypothetical protein
MNQDKKRVSSHSPRSGMHSGPGCGSRCSGQGDCPCKYPEMSTSPEPSRRQKVQDTEMDRGSRDSPLSCFQAWNMVADRTEVPVLETYHPIYPGRMRKGMSSRIREKNFIGSPAIRNIH